MKDVACLKEMTAALIVQNGRILLVHNIKHGQLRIEPPGGKKEKDETLLQCVVREVKEELGIHIVPGKLFGVYETDSPEGAFKVHMYLSSIKEGALRIMESDIISAYGWYSYTNILELMKQGVLVPNLCACIDKLGAYLQK